MPKTANYTQRLLRGKREHKRARIWQAMRIMRSFTLADLVATCEYPQEHKRSIGVFVSALRRAGYLTVQRRNIGKHEAPVFRLVRNSGPHCPSIVHRGATVLDHNDGTEYPVESGGRS